MRSASARDVRSTGSASSWRDRRPKAAASCGTTSARDRRARTGDDRRRPRAARVSAASAALVNGASGHAMDFDDTQLSTTRRSHLRPADASDVPPLAAALAVGERQHASGAALARSIPRPASRSSARLPKRSIPITTRRAFTRPARSGRSGPWRRRRKLLGLDGDATAHALAIAASLASASASTSAR